MALRHEDLRDSTGIPRKAISQPTTPPPIPVLNQPPTPPNRRSFLQTAARLATGAATASILPLAGCVPQANTIPPPAAQAPPLESGSLGAAAASRNLLYGCAVDTRALAADPAYAALIRAQCRILVAENAMKWAALRPTPTTFRFDQADALLAFAEANRMKLRGHNLVWHIDNPAWFDAYATPANARQLLVEHIQTVAGRYAGRLHSWDVVNEAIEPRDGRADGLRNSPWLRLAGDDYIELAFRTARLADPAALLTYNDYGIEAETPEAEQKRQAVLELLRRLIARRVPIDALGVQSHLAALATPAAGDGPAYGPGLLRLLAAVRELGLQVFLTELDVDDRACPANIPFRDAAVAATYRQYLDQVLAEPAVRAVLTWGITDRYTWLTNNAAKTHAQPERPLPFDPDYQPTPACTALHTAFTHR
jgi:endo-1,4-beta-xylanase